MRLRGRGASVVRLMALLFVTAACLSHAAAQTLTQDQIELLRLLPPEERNELLRSLGRSPVDSEIARPRDVSEPPIVEPREQPRSAREEEIAETAGERPREEGPTTGPIEPVAAKAAEVRRAFTSFLEESRPLTVDVELTQFGYELFAGAPTTFAPATDIPVSPNYTIGPGDEIHVQLYGKTNLTADPVVDRDGVIAFPHLGPIAVAGLTFSEMKEVVANEIENRMIGVNVSISMGRLRSIRIFVLGDVYQPGSYTVSGLSTLTNALFASGGVQKIGSLRSTQLKRNGQVIQELDLYDLLIHGDTSGDVRLMPGDVIFVPPVGPLVGIAGEVLRPAIYETKGPMTARDLIDVAGGLRPTAYTDLIQLERVEEGERVTYDMSLAGTEFWSLKDGDLLKVFQVLDRDERVVFLEGNVLRPGKRQHFEGMRILDLIPSTDDLLPETLFGYGLIERENEVNREPEYIAFDLGAAVLDSDEAANVPLRARDRVYVFHRAHFRDVPRVAVRGEVRSPGTYEYKKDMRVLDLLLAAGGLTRDAWLHEAELFRTDPVTLDVTKTCLDLRSVLAVDPEHNLLLQDLDELAIHSVWEFKVKEEVEILGKVNYPGRYPLFDGMRVSDLIFAGGSLHEEAYRKEAELTRYEVVDGERRELHHLILDLKAILSGSSTADLSLQPYDRVLIRSITNWRRYEEVYVSGEVAFPGSYPIEEGERLSDLLERFGGLLEDAYLPAAVFTRESVRELHAAQLERMADQLDADIARLSAPEAGRLSAGELASKEAALDAANQLLAEIRSAEATGRMVIRVEPAEKLRGSRYDLVLRHGDRLHVPKRPDFVMVMGQVNNPTAFQYDKGKRASHYIRLAGGGTRFSDMRRAYIVRADGSVERNRRASIRPGDVVIVPENLDRFAGVQFLLDVSQVLYQVGLAAASAHTVGVF